MNLKRNPPLTNYATKMMSALLTYSDQVEVLIIFVT